MANMVKRQLSVKEDFVDAQSLKTDTLALLLDSVDILVDHLPAS